MMAVDDVDVGYEWRIMRNNGNNVQCADYKPLIGKEVKSGFG